MTTEAEAEREPEREEDEEGQQGGASGHWIRCAAGVLPTIELRSTCVRHTDRHIQPRITPSYLNVTAAPEARDGGRRSVDVTLGLERVARGDRAHVHGGARAVGRSAAREAGLAPAVFRARASVLYAEA